MNISVFNYENYVLDFLEGTLSTKEQALFLQFLQENPQVEKEIQGLTHNKIRLQPSQTIEFQEQRFLKKKITDPVLLNKEKDLAHFFKPKKQINFSIFFQKFSHLAGVVALLFWLGFFAWKNILNKESINTEKAISTTVIENLVTFSEPEPLIVPAIVAQNQYENQKKKTKNIEKIKDFSDENTMQENGKNIEIVHRQQIETKNAPQTVMSNAIDLGEEKKSNLEVTPENTFDFSDEKKAVKSLVGIIRFSVKKAKGNYEK